MPAPLRRLLSIAGLAVAAALLPGAATAVAAPAKAAVPACPCHHHDHQQQAPQDAWIHYLTNVAGATQQFAPRQVTPGTSAPASVSF